MRQTKKQGEKKGSGMLNLAPITGETPWAEGDAAKKIGINVPFPEPLMMQMDYLLEHRAIRSKSSFIRDAVAAAATQEVARLRRLQQALRQMDEEDDQR